MTRGGRRFSFPQRRRTGDSARRSRRGVRTGTSRRNRRRSQSSASCSAVCGNSPSTASRSISTRPPAGSTPFRLMCTLKPDVLKGSPPALTTTIRLRIAWSNLQTALSCRLRRMMLLSTALCSMRRASPFSSSARWRRLRRSMANTVLPSRRSKLATSANS